VRSRLPDSLTAYATDHSRGATLSALANREVMQRVLIVDGQSLFAEAIRSALEAAGVIVVGVSGTAEDAVPSVLRKRPDLVLMDVALPDESGLFAGRRILQDWPEAKILALTALEEPRVAEEALRIGFRGYLTKRTPVAEFVSSVRAVLDGQRIMPHRLGSASRQVAEHEDAGLLAAHLTPREREVLALLSRGANGREIAAALAISRNTVRTHVQSILTKLQVHSRLEASTFAVRHRLTALPRADASTGVPPIVDRSSRTVLGSNGHRHAGTPSDQVERPSSPRSVWSTAGRRTGQTGGSDAPVPIRVLLADQHALFREALRAIFDAEPDLLVVAEAGTGFQAVEEAGREEPDVAILHAGLEACDAIQVVGLLQGRVPGCRLLILADGEDQGILAAAVEAGASGFHTKRGPLVGLLEATRALSRGDAVIPPRMLGGLLSRLISHRHELDIAQERLARLTRRERQVLGLLAEGADNDAIARTLVISPQTARTHIQNILSKLEVHSRLEATAFVFWSGSIQNLETSNGAHQVRATQG
jgi:two-component system, NarL family, nitrate/nitrite response regulator NarL